MYQGAKLRELRGLYLYGDYQYGKVWGLRYDHAAKKVTSHRVLAISTVKISSFGVGRDGHFMRSIMMRGRSRSSRRLPPQAKMPPFPRRLSETGLFSSVMNHR